MKRVLLLFKQATDSKLYVNTLPPLGLLSIASSLEKRGIPVDIVDGQVDATVPDYRRYSAIFLAINVSNIEHSILAAQRARSENPRANIIAGGPLGRRQADYLIGFPEIDAVILGEAEETALDLLTCADKTEIPGLVLRGNNGTTHYTGDRRMQMKLDDLPFAALDKVPLEKYNLVIKKRKRVSSIITSRGCPHSCIFCLHSKVWRQRSAAHVVSEIEWQTNTLGVQELAINDDSFALNRQRVIDICDAIKQRKIDVVWQLKNGVRVDEVDLEMLTKMRDAGLWLISVAPETGSDESLRKIDKGFTLDRVRQVVEWSKDLGLKTFGLFTVGYPWETEEHLQQTLDFSRELSTDFVQFCRVLPMEGTPLYDMMGITPSDEFKENGVQHGTMKHNQLLISPKTIQSFIKRGYRSHYLKPGNLWRISQTLFPSDILSLARFSLKSKSM